MSLKFDIYIFLKTILNVIKRKNIYPSTESNKASESHK